MAEARTLGHIAMDAFYSRAPTSIEYWEGDVASATRDRFNHVASAVLAASPASTAGGPVAWTLAWPLDIKLGRVNAKTTFESFEKAKAYAADCMKPTGFDPSPKRVNVVPLYDHSAPSVAPEKLTDERIDNIADLVIKGMPDGIRGFCKVWGWQQFARSLIEVVFPGESVNRELADALQALHDDIADYARINNIGGFDNHCMVRARAALAGVKEASHG